MCICVCICANNMQILGFGGVGGVRRWGGDTIGGGRGGCGGPGTGLIYTYQSGIAWDSMVLDITHCLVQGTVVPLKTCGPHGPRMMAVRHKDSRRMAFP